CASVGSKAYFFTAGEMGGRPGWAAHTLTPSIALISSIATFDRECLLSAARFPQPGYVILRYADSPNCLIVGDGRRSVPRNGAFLCTDGPSRAAVPSSAPQRMLETVA